MRARRPREGPPQGGARLPLRRGRHHRRARHRVRAQARRECRVPAARRELAAARQLLHRAHARRGRVRGRRRGRPPRTRSSTRWRAASARRWPSTPGCGARTSSSSRRSWPCSTGCRTSSNSSRREPARRARRNAWPSATPVWLKMGASAEPAARATMPKVGKAKRLSATDIEVEKGYSLAAAHAEAERCLQCECPSLAPATCSAWASSTASPPTTGRQGQPRPRGGAAARAPLHPPRHGPLHRLRPLRAGLPRRGRPGLLRLHRARLHASTSTRPTARPCSWPTASAAAAASPPAPPARSPSTSGSSASFKVDESRCIMCRECVNVCPVDALKETNHFEDARTEWLDLVAQGSQLAGGHRMCAGCGAPIVVRQVLMGTSDPVVVSAATGCLEVSTTIYPYTSWKGSYIHTAFENAAATLSGVETAFRALKKKGAHRGERQVHRLRRRRRHLRHRPAVASPAPWSAATRCSTSATTTAPT